MARHKKLGLYWGENGISFVEVHKDVAVLSASLSFASLELDPVVGIKSRTEDLRLLDLIQSTFKNARFSTVDTFFSLPSKDVIIRWFVIPWMRPNEIEGVVGFEAKKYVPFPLEELVFTYHPSTFTKDGVRQIGVSFIAIRKSVLSSYVNVLRQTGLNVVFSEPSSMSLIRALVHRRIITADKVAAVLSFSQDSGEIMITSQGHVKFIRDFKLSMPSGQHSDEEKTMLRAKLFNEVKMSLDFYTRQQADADVGVIIALTTGLNKVALDGLSDDLGVPVQIFEPSQVLDNIGSPDIGHIEGFGAALSGAVTTVVDLNLSETQEQLEQKKEEQKTAGKSQKMALMFGGCVFAAAVFGGVWLWSTGAVSEKERELASITEKLGTFAEVSLGDIEAKKDFEQKKIDALKSLSFRSETAPFVVRLVTLLPEGAWLRSLDLSFQEGTPVRKGAVQDDGAKTPAEYNIVKTGTKLSIQGNIYLGDTNAEFQGVNDFINTLRADEKFSVWFKAIKLGLLQTVEIDGFQATSFTITCE